MTVTVLLGTLDKLLQTTYQCKFQTQIPRIQEKKNSQNRCKFQSRPSYRVDITKGKRTLDNKDILTLVCSGTSGISTFHRTKHSFSSMYFSMN